MTELAQHIENLLLENDCVILPSLGGFVAHYAHSSRPDDATNHILPPIRTVGFNPRLKINDGVLAQSFMNVYHTNFPDANKMVEKHVSLLMDVLHMDGKAILPGIGELRYTIEGKYYFTPFDNQLTTPHLYGLESFQLAPLSPTGLIEVEPKAKDKATCTRLVARTEKCYQRADLSAAEPADSVQWISNLPVSGSTFRRRVSQIGQTTSRRMASALTAMIIILLFALFPSVPVSNTELYQGNYAQLLPTCFIEQMEKQAITLTPVESTSESKSTKETKKKVAVRSVKEVKIAKAASTDAPSGPKEEVTPCAKSESHRYCIIVASLGSNRDAESFAKSLQEKGYTKSRAIIGDGKRRVSIDEYATGGEAQSALSDIRQIKGFENAWILKQ